MTVLERVRELLIKNSPMAICDDCIKEMLGLSIREHANQKTQQLASMPKFDRRKDVCGKCGSTKKVIRYG
jgi:hypothetical protein